MKFDDILEFEIKQFKNGLGSNVNYTVLDTVNTKIVLYKALSDALRDGARRNKLSFKNENIVDDFVKEFYTFAYEKKQWTEDMFNEFFEQMIQKFINKMKDIKKDAFTSYGYAQKFVSMSFKYMYCFDTAERENFKYCKLPLDKYTINWYKTVGNIDIKNKFKKIKYAWSKIEDKKLYDDIQNDIDDVLRKGYYYCVCCGNPNETIRLSNNKLECEFVIWSQEMLNELYAQIIKEKHHQGRLGITIK